MIGPGLRLRADLTCARERVHFQERDWNRTSDLWYRQPHSRGERIGSDLLLLPGVTAVIRDGEQFLLARHAHSGQWSLIGGAVEPGEEPSVAVVREVFEETGARIRIDGIVGAYGGRPMMVEYPNGDRVGYVTTAYECHLLDTPHPDMDELLELGWFARDAIFHLPRRDWIDRVISDCK